MSQAAHRSLGLAVEADPRFAHLFEEVACDLCGGLEHRVLYPSTLSEEDLEHSLEQHTYSGWSNTAGRIVECTGCRLRFVTPREKATGIWQTYRQIVDPLYLENLDLRRVSFARGLRQIERLRRPPGRLLDVGCSVGVFLDLCRESGWRAEGVEASEWSSARARESGFVVHNELFERAELEEGAYDVVCFWDVLEHVPSPRLALEKARRLLKPGGLLVVSTPNARSLPALLMRRRWWFIERDHIYYYTPGSLGRQLRGQGFEPSAWHVVWRTYPARYLFHKLGSYLPTPARWLGAAAEKLRVAGWPFAIPAGQLTVLAKKN